MTERRIVQSRVITDDTSSSSDSSDDSSSDDDAGQDFTADLVLTGNVVGSLIADGTDAGGTNENANFVSEQDGTSTIALETRQVAALTNPEKNVALFKFPKSVIKTCLKRSYPAFPWA